MLFQTEHIDLIRKGEKTVTRRDWKRKMVKIDGIYPAQEEMFQKKGNCKVFIRVTGLRKEKLGKITKREARKEGNYTIEEFKELWKDLNGSWNTDLEVFVIDFYPMSPREVELQS